MGLLQYVTETDITLSPQHTHTHAHLYTHYPKTYICIFPKNTHMRGVRVNALKLPFTEQEGE